MIAEKIVENFKDTMNIHIIRPATVCGISPRMRLDVSVNMFTFQAMKFKNVCIRRQSNKTQYSYK